MTTSRKTRSIRELFDGFDVAARDYLIEKPRAYYEQVRYKLAHLPETNFNLGCDFAERGQWLDAIFRFRLAIFLKPGYVQAYYNLGCCSMQLGKLDKAREAFQRTLTYDPTHAEARFMLSAVTPALPPAQLPKTMPANLVKGFFTQIADEYDQLSEANGYKGGQMGLDAAKLYLPRGDGLRLIDFGSGSGLAARPWRGMSRELLAVECTQAMVAKSETARVGDHPLYDRVLKADINTIEPGTFMPGTSDVILCIDTAQFLGDLTPMLRTAYAALVPGGLLVLTVEPFDAKHGYGVNPATSRFGHAVEDVKRLAAVGFDLKRDARVPLYEAQQAHLFVFARKAIS